MARSHKVVVDNLTFDLRNSVAQSTKAELRSTLRDHLSTFGKDSSTVGEVAVRIHPPRSLNVEDDIKAIASLPNVDAIVIPKVRSAASLALVEDMLRHAAPHRAATTSESGETEQAARPFKLLASIDTAEGIMDLKDICNATPNLKSRTSTSHCCCLGSVGESPCSHGGACCSQSPPDSP
jgi:citrate lyase subunit beta-like protein